MTDQYNVENIIDVSGLNHKVSEITQEINFYTENSVSYTHLTLPTKRIV